MKLNKLKLISSAFLTLDLIFINAFANAQNVDSRKFEISSKGSCKAEKVDLDLEGIYFLKNTMVKQSAKDGYRILEVDNDGVDIKYYANNDVLKRTIPLDVAMKILSFNKDKGDIDIEVNFILLDGQVAIYWKETYLHRLYKQGVFKVENDELVFFCQGKGGTYTSH